MATNHEKLVTAYLDGELSAAEAAELDQSLTPEQKVNLAGEIKFERAIGERLAGGAKCPDELWQRTMAAVGAKVSPVAEFRPRRNWKYAVTALAAMLALTMAGLLINYNTTQTPSILAMEKGTTVEMLQALAELEGHETDDVNAYFKEHGFDLAMTTADVQIPGDHHTPRVLLGMRPAKNRGEDVMELLFNCCGRPLKVVVAKKGGETAREIGDAMAEGTIQVSRRVGDYVTALVGRHEALGLLDYLTEPEESA
ncbi:MAG: hypothetical protein HUU46_03270 [Candidatus Hydrogenedentes bacterium]|nr:hypothetical protein [Candidatus Hydrogenedentota bacterium]